MNEQSDLERNHWRLAKLNFIIGLSQGLLAIDAFSKGDIITMFIYLIALGLWLYIVALNIKVARIYRERKQQG